MKQEYEKRLRYLEYTFHELPAGVLYGANGANEAKCAELMNEAQRIEVLSATLGIDNSKFIENCRWHYERYPHYLSRQKHFWGYGTCIQKHNGQNKVKA